jgi:hypothetical protein
MIMEVFRRYKVQTHHASPFRGLWYNALREFGQHGFDVVCGAIRNSHFRWEILRWSLLNMT